MKTKLIAKNDYLVEEFIKDSKFVVNENGDIFRGNKKLGRKDKEGYVEIYYKGVRLKAHRIVYAKFKGTLDEELVIEHKDGTPDNCKPNNLLLCTQQENIEYKNRRLKRNKKI